MHSLISTSHHRKYMHVGTLHSFKALTSAAMKKIHISTPLTQGIVQTDRRASFQSNRPRRLSLGKVVLQSLSCQRHFMSVRLTKSQIKCWLKVTPRRKSASPFNKRAKLNKVKRVTMRIIRRKRNKSAGYRDKRRRRGSNM